MQKSTLTVIGLIAAVLLIACGDDQQTLPTQPTPVTPQVPTTPANQAPSPTGSIAEQQIEAGKATTVDVAQYFSDPDGDTLTYAATSSNTHVAEVAMDGSILTITARNSGRADIQVTATDPENLTATHTFSASVVRPEPPADPYQPLEGLRVSPGRVTFLFISAGRCIVMSNTNINGTRYDTHSSKWQSRSGPAAWTDVPGTEQDGGLCSNDPSDPGEYRLVGEISIDGRGMYSSENTITVQ